MNRAWKEIIKKIRESRKFLITAHVSLEGDALGSELATFILLKRLHKRAVIYNNDQTPEIYKFLPYSEVIRNNLKGDKFDAAIVLDCSDSSRTGKVKDYLSRVDCIINIDHHISNTLFGDINLIEPKVSSTAEMLYGLCRRLHVMDRKIALCLYTGIFTDTGNFTYTNTTKETHKIVANLIHYNVSPRIIYENTHSLCDYTDLKNIGLIISHLKFDASGKICWAIIKHWQDKNYDLTEVIFSTMRLLRNVEVLILFKRIESKKIRVNFRSRSHVDVNKIAKFFGGGGHKSASGTTIEDTLESAVKKVVSFVERHTIE
jgi:phosphoesterase RecJ-like protein